LSLLFRARFVFDFTEVLGRCKESVQATPHARWVWILSHSGACRSISQKYFVCAGLFSWGGWSSFGRTKI